MDGPTAPRLSSVHSVAGDRPSPAGFCISPVSSGYATSSVARNPSDRHASYSECTGRTTSSQGPHPASSWLTSRLSKNHLRTGDRRSQSCSVSPWKRPGRPTSSSTPAATWCAGTNANKDTLYRSRGVGVRDTGVRLPGWKPPCRFRFRQTV